MFDATRNRNREDAGRLFRSVITARQIHDRLRAAGFLAFRDRAVSLDGRFRSHGLKQIAQAIARGVIGIGGLEDRIEIIPIRVIADRRRLGKPSRRTSC